MVGDGLGKKTRGQEFDLDFGGQKLKVKKSLGKGNTVLRADGQLGQNYGQLADELSTSMSGSQVGKDIIKTYAGGKPTNAKVAELTSIMFGAEAWRAKSLTGGGTAEVTAPLMTMLLLEGKSSLKEGFGTAEEWKQLGQARKEATQELKEVRKEKKQQGKDWKKSEPQKKKRSQLIRLGKIQAKKRGIYTRRTGGIFAESRVGASRAIRAANRIIGSGKSPGKGSQAHLDGDDIMARIAKMVTMAVGKNEYTDMNELEIDIEDKLKEFSTLVEKQRSGK